MATRRSSAISAHQDHDAASPAAKNQKKKFLLQIHCTSYERKSIKSLNQNCIENLLAYHSKLFSNMSAEKGSQYEEISSEHQQGVSSSTY